MIISTKQIALFGLQTSTTSLLKDLNNDSTIQYSLIDKNNLDEVDLILSQNPELIVLYEKDLSSEYSSKILNYITKNEKLPCILITNDLNPEIEQVIKTRDFFSVIHPGEDSEVLAKNIETAITQALHINRKFNTLESELNLHKMQVDELTETNAHLITATFRERSLKKELESSKALIEEQSKKILDSINYSLRIQQSIIPSQEVFANALNQHFVYYKPKDVVSGDFPWLIERDEYTYFAAVDCTGHGVPGAMMSMIGNLLLNSIVNNGLEIKTPSQILSELHKAVVRTLKQDAEGNKAADGMDVALCRMNKARTELLFSGAHLPLFFVRNGELEVFKGDKFPVGGMQYRNRNTYSDHKIELNKNDRIFIFSDGIIDQVGGPEKMKWMSSSLKEFLISQVGFEMNEIKENIHNTFEAYKGSNKQVDDVLLIGVEI